MGFSNQCMEKVNVPAGLQSPSVDFFNQGVEQKFNLSVEEDYLPAGQLPRRSTPPSRRRYFMSPRMLTWPPQSARQLQLLRWLNRTHRNLGVHLPVNRHQTKFAAWGTRFHGRLVYEDEVDPEFGWLLIAGVTI